MWLSKIDNDGLAYGFILQIRARTLDYKAVSVVRWLHHTAWNLTDNSLNQILMGEIEKKKKKLFQFSQPGVNFWQKMQIKYIQGTRFLMKYGVTISLAIQERLTFILRESVKRLSVGKMITNGN